MEAVQESLKMKSNVLFGECLVSIGEADDKIIIAMADPLNVIAIDTITLKLKCRIKVVVSSRLDIRRAIEASHTRKAMVDCFEAV